MKNKNTTLLSLDTSSTITGWALFENGEYKTSGILNWSHIKKMNERLEIMYIDIIQNIQKLEPDIIVLEKDIVGSGKRQNMSTINTLVKLIGGIWGYCLQLNSNTTMDYTNGDFKIFYTEYSPSEWRKLVGIKERKREECKKASIKRVKEKYGIEVDDNEADAINIGDAYCIEWNK